MGGEPGHFEFNLKAEEGVLKLRFKPVKHRDECPQFRSESPSSESLVAECDVIHCNMPMKEIELNRDWIVYYCGIGCGLRLKLKKVDCQRAGQLRAILGY